MRSSTVKVLLCVWSIAGYWSTPLLTEGSSTPSGNRDRNPTHRFVNPGGNRMRRQEMWKESNIMFNIEDYGLLKAPPSFSPASHGPVVFFRSPRGGVPSPPRNVHPRVMPPPSQKASEAPLMSQDCLPSSKTLTGSSSYPQSLAPVPP